MATYSSGSIIGNRSFGARMRKYKNLRGWEVPHLPSSFAPKNIEGLWQWSNLDMDPVPPMFRTWTVTSWCTYWISDALNVATYSLAASMLAIGLSWKEALIAIVVGFTIISWVMTAVGTIGARLHVPFPVLNRSSFGFYFSYFSVVSRLVLAMFWFGVQTYTGSECVYQMLKAIFPSIASMKNTLPVEGHITSIGLLCYFIYWMFQLPFLLIGPQNVRWLFMAKAIIVPPTWVALIIWSFKTTGGGEIFRQKPTISGSELVWAWFAALNSALGNISTVAVNITDFTRYAQQPKDIMIQLFLIPFAFTFGSFVGIAATSAGYILYGEYFWDPLRLIDQWDNRAAAFFCSLAWAIATTCTNISCNSLSAANDLTALFPKYINIRRGQVICALIGGWAVCPWQILSTAIGFLNFMAGYTVFLGPIAGIMISDYWFVHRGNVDVPSMYRPMARYRYHYGVNWRAALALLISVPPNLPGLFNSINPNIPVYGAAYLYKLSWLTGFTLASAVYTFTSLMWPAKETFLAQPIHDDEEFAVTYEMSQSRDESMTEKGMLNHALGTVETRT